MTDIALMKVKRKIDVYLAHHGVKGQKWGVRRYQNKDGTLTAEGRFRYNIKTKYDTFDPTLVDRSHTDYNVNKWGNSKENNILYITGYSGSGKSTLAKEIAKDNNADYINIDLYTLKTTNKYEKSMSKTFNAYLDKNVPDWKNMQKEAYEVLTRNNRRDKYKAGLWFDTFEDALKKYGESQYEKQKVVAEGIQILDETLFYNNKSALKGKPLIIMNTSLVESNLSGALRDKQPLSKLISDDRVTQAINWVNYVGILKKSIE